jgi:CubicO group peptidase (beta-lactamase class C family)
MVNKLHTSLDQQLDAIMQDAITRGVTPTAGIAVIHRDGLLLDAAWGHVDPDTQQQPVSTSHLFDLASITKLFTTTAFLGLVSAGRVDLNTPLVDVIPEFGHVSPRPLDGGQDPHSKQYLPTPAAHAGQTVDPAQVTFWHLLTHTSGLPPWRDVFNAAGPAPTPPTTPDPLARDIRWQNALQALVRYNFVGAPQPKVVRYSDVGLMLLGEAVARLQGSTLHNAIDVLVLQPAGLRGMFFNPVRDGHASLQQTLPTEDDPTWRKRRVWGEVHDENACGVGGVAGHAGLFASASSVARFGHIWQHQPDVFGIDAELAASAKQPHAITDWQRRGLGFVLKGLTGNSSAGEVFGPNTYGHTGFTGTSLWIDPDADLIIACLTNSVYPGRGAPGIHELRRAVHDCIASGLI